MENGPAVQMLTFNFAGEAFLGVRGTQEGPRFSAGSEGEGFDDDHEVFVPVLSVTGSSSCRELRWWRHMSNDTPKVLEPSTAPCRRKKISTLPSSLLQKLSTVSATFIATQLQQWAAKRAVEKGVSRPRGLAPIRRDLFGVLRRGPNPCSQGLPPPRSDEFPAHAHVGSRADARRVP